MNIMQINGTYKSGSTGNLSYELSEFFLSNGHKSKCFYAIGPIYDEYTVKIGTTFDRKVHAILSRITGLQGYFSYYETKKLLRKIKEFKPDIVQLHNLHSNYINLNILFNYLANKNITTVITLHDCWFFTGKCTHFVEDNCLKWMEKCGGCPLLYKDNVNPTLFFDTTKKCLSDKKNWYSKINNLGVIGVSKWISSEAEKSILKEATITTIYNWVDQTKFFPRDIKKIKKTFSLENKKVLLMVATNISKEKGFDVLVGLSQELEKDFQIIVVGKNKYGLDIPKNTIHIECINNQDELAQLYSLADVCINTTKYETFGMVTAESLACGTPVIVFNNTASPELVDSKTGIILNENEDMKAIIKAIKKIINMDSEIISRNCVDRVSEKFNKNMNMGKYLDFYEKLLVKKKNVGEMNEKNYNKIF